MAVKKTPPRPERSPSGPRPRRTPRTAGPASTRARDLRFELFLAVVAVAVVAALVAAATRSGDDRTPTGTAARAATPTTAPPTATSGPPRQASAADPLRLLVAGDSLVGYLPMVLDEELAGQPVEVINASKTSSGLARPDFYDWPGTLRRLMDEHDPDVVVIGLGGNDTQSLQTDAGTIRREDPGWQGEDARRVAEALDAVAAEGRTLWWVGLPLSERENLEELRPKLTGAVTSEIAKRPWAHYVDTLPVLAPDGRYHVELPGPDGEPVVVRADDGIHLSPAGTRMIADAFIGRIAEERGFDA